MVKVVLLVLLLAASATGQVADELSPPTATPGILENLPLDAARRSALQTAMQERDYIGAEKLLAAEVDRNPKSRSLLVALANILFLDGKYWNAAIALKQAEILSPLDERNRFVLAMAYVALNQKNHAVPELEKLAQSNPSNASYPYWLSRLAYQKTDLAAALPYAESAVRLDPNFMKAYDNLGLCYEALGRMDDAIHAYEHAIRLNRQAPSRSPWPSMNLGKLLLRLDRLDEAEANLRESLSIDSRFPKAHFRLGQVLEKRKRYEEAVQELEQAVRLDPSYPEPHYALGRIYRLRGNTKSAEKAWRMFEDLRKKEKERGAYRPD